MHFRSLYLFRCTHVLAYTLNLNIVSIQCSTTIINSILWKCTCCHITHFFSCFYFCALIVEIGVLSSIKILWLFVLYSCTTFYICTVWTTFFLCYIYLCCLSYPCYFETVYWHIWKKFFRLQEFSNKDTNPLIHLYEQLCGSVIQLFFQSCEDIQSNGL